MVREQKAEKGGSKNGETTTGTAKGNGKRKIKKDDVPEEAPIVQSSSSNSHDHRNNGVKSESSEGEQQLQLSGEEAEEEESSEGEDPKLRISQEAIFNVNKASLSEELNEKQKKEMKMHEELEANFILTSEKQMLEDLSSIYNKLMSLYEEQMEDLREAKREMSKLLDIVDRIG